MSTAGIILAAGFSRRLGRTKQDVVLGGATLLQRAVKTAHAAHLSPVCVVVNAAGKPGLACHSTLCKFVLNSNAEEGLASSIRTGVRAVLSVRGVSGAVLMTCDQILLTPDHLRGLYAQTELVTASGYGGKRGIPAYFPKNCFPQLLELHGDTGARHLLMDARLLQAEELLLDIDTESDVVRAEALFTTGTALG